jgi:hypothetical protein
LSGCADKNLNAAEAATQAKEDELTTFVLRIASHTREKELAQELHFVWGDLINSTIENYSKTYC